MIEVVEVLAIGLGAGTLVRTGGIAYLSVKANIRSHDPEWRRERANEWLLKELPSPCSRVGHEYKMDDECFWCGEPVYVYVWADPYKIGKPARRVWTSTVAWFRWEDGEVVDPAIKKDSLRDFQSVRVKVPRKAIVYPVGADPYRVDLERGFKAGNVMSETA